MLRQAAKMETVATRTIDAANRPSLFHCIMELPDRRTLQNIKGVPQWQALCPDFC
jgi:hypothetical protein